MTEFDKRDEDEGDMEDEYDKEETSEEDSDEEEIVDKSFSSEEMPQTFGEFAPYFKNTTESLFFSGCKNIIYVSYDFMMSDCLQLTMMFPFILNRFLKRTHFKNSEFASFRRRTGVTRNDLAVKLWLKCWICTAKTMVMVFKDSFSKEDYEKLRNCLDDERKLLPLVFIYHLIYKMRITNYYTYNRK